MQPLRLGSLFSGYGGLDMAVEEFFGARTAWHCQYDPEDKHQYAAQVLAHHWPGVPNLGDITAVDWDQIEPVDILAGGFPCTDVSLAGQRAGLNEQTRSGLWAHMARAIAVLRPKLVIIENVRGLLSADADRGVEPGTASVDPATGQPLTLRALGAVLGDLAGRGFDAEWCGVPASEVGAPHERFRVFVLAWPADAEGPRLEVGGLRGLLAGGGAAAADADQFGAHWPRTCGAGRDEPADHGQPAADSACLGHRNARSASVGGLPTTPVAGGAAAVAHTDRDTVRNQPVPEPRCRSEAIAELHGADAPADAEGDRRSEGRPESARLGGGSDPAVGGAPDWGVYEPAIRRWECVVGRPAPWPVDDRGRLSPALPEWMMGLPAGWLTVASAPPGMTESQVRNAQLKAAGNGVVPQQALAALHLLWQRATADQTASSAA